MHNRPTSGFKVESWWRTTLWTAPCRRERGVVCSAHHISYVHLWKDRCLVIVVLVTLYHNMPIIVLPTVVALHHPCNMWFQSALCWVPWVASVQKYLSEGSHRWSITWRFLCQICTALEAVLLKLHVKLTPGWALIQVNFDPIKEIEPKVRGGRSFVSGCSFARLRYIVYKEEVTGGKVHVYNRKNIW